MICIHLIHTYSVDAKSQRYTSNIPGICLHGEVALKEPGFNY